MNRFKTLPHLAITALVLIALAAGGVALFLRHEQTAEASALPNAARINRVNGEVGLNRSLDNNAQWIRAEQNSPVSVGDRIYTKDKADASLAFTGRNFARLDPDTSLDVLALSNDKTQVALREGAAMFDIGSLPSGNLFEVATPCGAIDLTEPGLYQLAINDSGNATATALSGVAQVVGQGGTGRIERGEVLTVPCQGSAPAVLSRVEPRAAGSVVDRYYRDRYPRLYDGRYDSYDTYLNDPFYYDPSRRFASYQYVTDYIPGVDDLDDYGDWQQLSGYGYGWSPRVDNGWAPYQTGYWTTDYPYGLTWVSSEPWGYAPYHYGRWAFISNQWFWIPDGVRTQPAYAPALVAFIPLQTDTIGWVPLAPGDPYLPRYYDENWNPSYLGRTPVVQERVINLNVPGAVTVVNVRDFNQVIDRRTIERVEAQQFANVRPVLDPFAVRNFRNVALRGPAAERRIDVPPVVTQRMVRPVITSTMPITPFRRDLAQRLQVQPVPEKARGERLQLRDNRQQTMAGVQAPQAAANQSNIAAEQTRERQMADLSRQAARGNRAAGQQMQQMRQQQRQEQQQQRQQAATQQRAERMATQQAQGERISNNAQPRKAAAPRQPQPQSQPPARASREQQYMRRRAPAPQANPQPAMRRQQQNAPRVVPPQAQPRARTIQTPNRPPANRQPRPQAAPQPQPVRQPRPAPAQPRPAPAQPRPQAQPQTNERRPPATQAAPSKPQPPGKRHP